MRKSREKLTALLRDIRACRLCASHLPHGVRPVLRMSATARLCIAGQAPGLRVHKSGVPYSDPSGERLRAWMGIDHDKFYDERLVAIVPMGFCFPGYDEAGADLPPRPECVRAWHDRLFAAGPRFDLVLAIGTYAHRYHLKGQPKKTVSETVRAWRDYGPTVVPLPHPSWRNNGWLKKNPWFESELLPYLRKRVQSVLSSAHCSSHSSP
jgi:uracil-DNA glycosylase